jgi:hypothetical protein
VKVLDRFLSDIAERTQKGLANIHRKVAIAGLRREGIVNKLEEVISDIGR